MNAPDFEALAREGCQWCRGSGNAGFEDVPIACKSCERTAAKLRKVWNLRGAEDERIAKAIRPLIGGPDRVMRAGMTGRDIAEAISVLDVDEGGD